ncbi:hypothetical protein FRC11_010618, partial [Ceratobasidium sp. 423]
MAFRALLGASVDYSGPVSRPLAALVNASIQISPAGRIQLPIILDFRSGEGRARIWDWYQQLPTTVFKAIEYRKEGGAAEHEFVVAYLNNSIVCRFDRRAREGQQGHALKHEGTEAEDSAHIIPQAQLKGSRVLLRFTLPKEQDLEFILAVCCGIQAHPKAKSYSLLYYNCYFFSWTLVMTIARQACRWEEATEIKHLWENIMGALTLPNIEPFLHRDPLRLDWFTKYLSLRDEDGGGMRFPGLYKSFVLDVPLPGFDLISKLKKLQPTLRDPPPSQGLMTEEYLFSSWDNRNIDRFHRYLDIREIARSGICEMIEKELRAYLDMNMPPNYLETLLLRSQLWSTLMGVVYSASSKAGKLAAERSLGQIGQTVGMGQKGLAVIKLIK